jgi:hypothetical protein
MLRIDPGDWTFRIGRARPLGAPEDGPAVRPYHRIDRGGCGSIRATETAFETLLSAFVLITLREAVDCEREPFGTSLCPTKQLTASGLA